MTTINDTTVINGVEFITYKHWSYDGNTGIYLKDGVTRVGEIINDENIFLSFDEQQKDWLNKTQSQEVLNIIFN